jgi:ATP-dependent metalloprotease FtsH
MKFLEKIIVSISLVAILGSISSFIFSENNYAKQIGYKEMNKLVNVTSLNVNGNVAYLYTNDTIYPEFQYDIGNNKLFEEYLDSVDFNEIDIFYNTKSNFFLILLYNLPTILFCYVMLKNLSMHMDTFQSSYFTVYKKGDTSNSVKFSDISGLKEVKEDVNEFVDIFKGSDKFKKMNCKVPRGALFYGPPGTGKTLIAKAIANECNTSFIHVTGSSFNEKFVGVGQSRIRKLFKTARSRKPCVIFIDELDTLGKSRGVMNEGHNEHENTLNSLLSEMDGLESNDMVLVFGATNRPQLLDEALTRPGRFDRKIEFNLPTKSEREDILELYLKKYPVVEKKQKLIKSIAEVTYGFSGADISNLCNEAAIKAVKNKKDKIDYKELDDALSYIVVGSKRESNKLEKSDKTTVAYHEAGHAFMSYIQVQTETPCKVSIIPTTKGALGYSMSNQKEKKLRTKAELIQQMGVIIGGRCSESIFLDDVTTGASDDLFKLRKLIKSYVSNYGFTEKLSGMNVMDDGMLSEKTKENIDNHVQTIANKIIKSTNKILLENKEHVRKLVNILLKKEEINKSDLISALGKKLESTININNI